MITLVTTAFLPPVDYLLALYRSDSVLIEAHENYQKQSYRTRCEIVTSQGLQVLNVPIVHSHTGRPMPIREVAVEFRTPWQGKFLRALKSAYATAPFFIHYFEELAELVSCRTPSLLEYNTRLLRFLLEKFKVSAPLAYTTQYNLELEGIQDLRSFFHPKCPRSAVLEYYQVFADRLPFYPNVSAIDLLFNEGPCGLESC
ncbi:MAG: WbqC family protein [Bacteroides sp.]